MADFRVRVIVDPTQAAQGTKTVERQLQRVENQADKLRTVLLRTFGFVGAAAAITSTVRLLADFSQEMSTVQAISNATADEFAALRDEAKNLGITTRFTASEAAEGMVFLARAGFNATETLETADDALRLAQAGALSLGEAADIATNVLTGFRLETDDAARVVDVLALAANSANTDVRQLGQAMKFVAPIAAGVGVNVVEATAAVTALSNAGLQASLAGTGLRRVLSELESPSQKTVDVLGQLQVTADQVKVSEVGLTQALQVLANAGIDTGQALEIFGDRGGPAFEVLRTSIPDVVEMTARLQEADGTAERIAHTMDDNLNGALLAVKSALQGFVIELGDAGSTGALEDSLRGLAAALRFLAANIDDVVVALEVLGGGFLALKLAPLLTNLATATSRFVAFRLAVLQGNAVVLGSAEAVRQQAIFEAQAAQATAARTASVLAQIQAESARALVVTGSNEALFIQAAIEKQVAAATAANVAAQNAAIAANLKVATAMKATTLSARAASLATASIGGPLTIIVAGAAAAVVALRKFDDVLSEISDAQKISEGGSLTEFGKVNEKVLRTQEQIAALQKEIDDEQAKGGPGNPQALAQIERLQGVLGQYQEKLDRIKASTDKAREAAQEQREAQAALNLGFVESIANLKEEAELLKLSAREREIQAELLRTISKLEKDGAAELTDAQKAELEAQIRTNAALEDRADVLDSLRSPQEEFTRRLQTIQGLFDEGELSAEELARALTALRDEFAGKEGVNLDVKLPEVPDFKLPDFTAPESALEAFNRRLEEHARLVNLNNSERAIESELIRLQNDLRREGVTLSDEELAALHKRLEEAQKLDEEAKLLQKIRGPQEEYAATLETLNRLQDQGRISADEYAAALERLKGKTEEVANTAGAGLSAGLDIAQKKLTDVAGAAQNLVVNAFQGAEDAVVSFVTTGEADVSGLVDSILADLTRLLLHQAFQSLLGQGGGDTGVGGGLGLLASFFGGPKAEGGPVTPDKAFLVGENGPEIFTPPTAGSIVPAGETAATIASAQPAPVVNVSAPPAAVNVYNVDDPNAVPAGIESPQGEQAVLNVLQRNRRRVRNL